MTEILGYVFEMSEVTSGQTANGRNWQKRVVVLQTPRGNYIALDVFDVEQVQTMRKGDFIKCKIEVESRYNEQTQKWYTCVRAYDLRIYQQTN